MSAFRAVHGAGMSKRCFYEVLGIERTATIADIKGAYRKLAKEHHPDANHGDTTAEHRFKEISEAYEILKDDQKRAAYDRFGHAAFENGGGTAAKAIRSISLRPSPMCSTICSANSWVGGGRGARTAAPICATISRSAWRNPSRAAPRTSPCRRAVACEACGGTGAEAGSHPEQCTTCSGIGKVRAQQGFFTIERTCPQCRGAGRIVKNPCKACHGSGQLQKERTLAVDVPPGVEEGTRIRLAGEGQAGLNGGPPGDLYIFVSVGPHPIFQRDGHDLYCRAPVSIVTAALGGSFEVPTLEGGRVKVTVPEGTQSGRQFRLRGKGMPVLRGGGMSGDLYVELVVETPVKLSKKQKEMLRAFESESTPGSQPESEGFFAKLKEFWKGSAPN